MSILRISILHILFTVTNMFKNAPRNSFGIHSQKKRVCTTIYPNCHSKIDCFTSRHPHDYFMQNVL